MSQRRRWRPGRVARWLLLLAGACSVLWLCASLAVLAHAMRRAQPPFEEPPPSWIADELERLRLPTADGEELGGWFLEAESDDAPSVLLLHGRGGCRSGRLRSAMVFRRAGCAVLLLTHRAHGDSSGARDDFGWSARLDVVAGARWLAQRRPQAALVVCGTSLGAAAATLAAQELEGVDGYLLECLYRDLDSAARHRARLHLPPVLGHLAYAGLRAAAPILLPDWRSIAPVDAIARIPDHVPVLLLAGSLDRRAPVADARALLERVADHGELRIIPGADHAMLEFDCPQEYERAVLDLLGRVAARAAR